MTSPAAVSVPPNEMATLLVLLPIAAGADQLVRMDIAAMLGMLQQQVGSAILVLRIDEATHPAVVRSFDGRGLPAFVLTRHGVELWRQQGLPEGDDMAALLLSKLSPAPDASNLQAS